MTRDKWFYYGENLNAEIPSVHHIIQQVDYHYLTFVFTLHSKTLKSLQNIRNQLLHICHSENKHLAGLYNNLTCYAGKHLRYFQEVYLIFSIFWYASFLHLKWPHNFCKVIWQHLCCQPPTTNFFHSWIYVTI